MLNEQIKNWTKDYMACEKPAYPCEYVIRMFKGVYPNLNLKKLGGDYTNKSILDIGCGDGRNLYLFKELGFSDIAGTEVSQELINRVNKYMTALDFHPELRVGTNNNLNFENERFDYALSWNVCYYLDDNMDFSTHVKEYARVMKKNAILVFSIPTKDCFVYKDGIEKDGFMEIKDDWFNIRNGSIQKIFQNENDIVNWFSPYFDDFIFGTINDNCFGLNYKWYIGCCRKK